VFECKRINNAYTNKPLGMYHFNTLRTGSFKLFKRPFPGFLTISINFYTVSLKIYNKFTNYFCELKFSGNTHQRP